MYDDQERQAALLAAFQTALKENPAAPPPAGLDPAVVAVARQLARLPQQHEPDPTFVSALAGRLDLPPATPSRAVALPWYRPHRHAPIPATPPALTAREDAPQVRRGPWSRLLFGANVLATIALIAVFALAAAVVLPVMRAGEARRGAASDPTATTGTAQSSNCTGTLAPQQPATPPDRPIPATPTGREAELFIPCAFERDPGLQRAERAGLVQHLNASQTSNGGTLTVERVYADGNRIVVAYTIVGPEWATDDFRFSPREVATLTNGAGQEYPRISGGVSGYGGTVGGRRFDAKILIFNASLLPVDATQETFHLVVPEVALQRLGAAGDVPTPRAANGSGVQRTPPGEPMIVQRTPSNAVRAGVVGPWALTFTLPIAPTRVAEVNQTVTAPVVAAYSQGEANTIVPQCAACPDAPADGIAITVERVVTTPSETRVYLRFQAPAVARQAGWEVRSIAIQDPDSPPTQQGGTRALPDGGVVISFTNPLYDKRGEWTLTIGELWALVPPDRADDRHGFVQVRLNGQWVYRFTMP